MGSSGIQNGVCFSMYFHVFPENHGGSSDVFPSQTPFRMDQTEDPTFFKLHPKWCLFFHGQNLDVFRGYEFVARKDPLDRQTC